MNSILELQKMDTGAEEVNKEYSTLSVYNCQNGNGGN